MTALILALVLAGQPPITVVLPNGQTIRAESADYDLATQTLRITANGVFKDSFE